MIKKFFVVLFLLYSSLSFSQSDEFVFLFDNSGSMSGYYRETASTYKSFCKTLIKNSVSADDYLKIFLFSKSDPKRSLISPKEIYEGSGKDFISSNFDNDFRLMRASDGDFGTTDLIEALEKAESSFKSGAGIIWLVTDNINDNSGSGDSSFANTLEFYKKIRNSEKIRKILMYPIPEKVTEAGYTSFGYVAYGMVWSEKSLSQTQLDYYDKIIQGTGIKQKAITLKPLDVGTLMLVPEVTKSKISPAKLYFDGKSLKGFDFSEGENIKETFSGLSLKSRLYPYIIKSARLDVRLENFESSDYSVKSIGTQKISPSAVSNVSPEGEVKGFTVIFDMPEVSPKFSLNTIFKDEFIIKGDLVLEVSNVDIFLDENYTDNFKQLFALQTVPEIFKPVLKDKKIITLIPLEIKIKYGSWRLFVLIGLILAVIIIIILILFLILKRKCFTLLIDDKEYLDFCINSLSSSSLLYNGNLIGSLGKSLSGKIYVEYPKNSEHRGKRVFLSENLPVFFDYEDDNFTKKEISVMLTKKNDSSIIDDNSADNFY